MAVSVLMPKATIDKNHRPPSLSRTARILRDLVSLRDAAFMDSPDDVPSRCFGEPRRMTARTPSFEARNGAHLLSERKCAHPGMTVEYVAPA